MTANAFTAIFAGVATALTADAKAALLGLVTQTTTNIKANPTTQTVAAQYALLFLSAPALVPMLETDAITAIATALQTAAETELAPSSGSGTAAPKAA